MNICILDGYTTNPGDLSWKGLEQLGELTVYDWTDPEQIVERAKNAEIVITNKTPLDQKTIAALPKMKYIGTLATGYNVVDVAAAKERGIPVCNVPTYCTKAVAQLTFALLFALTNHVYEHSVSVQNGDWVNSKDFCYWKTPLIEIAGKTIGIIGFGNIGREVAKIALAFGMKVLVYSRTKKELPQGCEWQSIKEVFQKSDVVSIHCPLTEETTHLVNKENLELMKSSAFIINTSRGGVIEEEELAQALNNGRIAGVAVDVLSTEPPKKENPLLTAKNCMITPHIAWASQESRTRLVEIVTQNVQKFIEGQPQNVVNS